MLPLRVRCLERVRLHVDLTSSVSWPWPWRRPEPFHWLLRSKSAGIMGGVTPMSPEWRRGLSTVAVVCALIFVTDIVILNVVGELPSEAWWTLAALSG